MSRNGFILSFFFKVNRKFGSKRKKKANITLFLKSPIYNFFILFFLKQNVNNIIVFKEQNFN